MWIENPKTNIMIKIDNARLLSVEEIYEDYQQLYGVYVDNNLIKEFRSKEDAKILYNKLKSMFPEIVQI